MNIHGVADMDDLISRLEHQLADLKEQRNQLAVPLCKVPDEILSNILNLLRDCAVPHSTHVHHADATSDDGGSEVEWYQDPPVEDWWAPTGVAISRRVWAVALRTSALWTTIRRSVIVDGHLRSRRNTLSRQVRHCLQRGGKHPVALQLGLIHSDDSEWHPLPQAMVQLVPRTRSLLIQVNCMDRHLPPGSSFMEPLLTQPWPALEYLEVTSCASDGHRRIGMRIDGNSFLGGLSSTLRGMCMEWAPNDGYWCFTQPPRVWQLEHLALRQLGLTLRHGLEPLHQLLSQTVHLISLEVTLVTASKKSLALFAPETLSPITLPHLRSLKITVHEPCVAIMLLDIIPTPSSHFSVAFTQQSGAETHSQLSLIHSTAIKILGFAYADASPLVGHKIIFLAPKPRSPRSLLWFQVSPPSSIYGNQSSKSVGFVGTCSAEVLSWFIRMASDVEVEKTMRYADVLNAIRSAPIIRQIKFHHWRSYCDPEYQSSDQASFMQGLQDNLQTRKHRGEPVITMLVDQRPYAYGNKNLIESQWLAQGLVGEIKEERKEDTNGGRWYQKLTRGRDSDWARRELNGEGIDEENVDGDDDDEDASDDDE